MHHTLPAELGPRHVVREDLGRRRQPQALGKHASDACSAVGGIMKRGVPEATGKGWDAETRWHRKTERRRDKRLIEAIYRKRWK